MIYDVIFWDTIGMPYDGDTPLKQALGGSEHQVILLAEALAKKGKKVLVLNTKRTESSSTIRGVTYDCSEEKWWEEHCQTLIVCRYSKRPTKIIHQKLLVWVTDNYAPEAYEHHLNERYKPLSMVFLSKWQKDQWYNPDNSTVIPNMLPDLGEYLPPAYPRAFVYASSDINDRLGVTLGQWADLYQPGMGLLIYTPGYEGETDTIKDLKANGNWWFEKFGVTFFGPNPFDAVVKALSYASGLFMVNTMTETFCLVAAMAEKMGRRVHMLCLNGYGALKETVNSSLVTRDAKQFARNVIDCPSPGIWPANDFSEETVVSQWLKLLAPQEPTNVIVEEIDAPHCKECGSLMIRFENLFKCTNCQALSSLKGPTKIILNMIVKDEAHVIKRCLDSVKHLIDSWVIVDTGSTDGTQQIIKDVLADIPGVIHERPWVHFAHNRSEAIKLGEKFVRRSENSLHGKWFLLLIDADDIYQGFISQPLTADVYTVNISDDGGRQSYHRQQLFRVGKGFRYEGVRHEYPTTDQPRIEAHLDSLTYVRVGGGARAKDPDTLIKDALALRKHLEEHPNDTRTAYYLAQSWKDAQEYTLALEAYDHRISLHPQGFHEECYLANLFAGRISKGLKRNPVAYWMDAFNLNPSRAEAQYELALYYREKECWHLAALWGAYGQRILPQANQALFLETEIYRWKVIDELAVALTWTGENKKALELFEQVMKVCPDSECDRILKSINHCKAIIAKTICHGG